MSGLRRLKFGRRDIGAATVEFAVVLPLLLSFLFGIVEFGRVFMVNQMLTSAAREGARAATMPGANNEMVTARIAQELASAGLTADILEFSPADVSSAQRDEPVTVRVGIDYESIAWLPGFIPGFTGRQLQGVVVMRKEGFS